MFKQNIIATCLILFVGFALQAQTQYSYYFDNGVNQVEKPHAVFEGLGQYEIGFFELKVLDKMQWINCKLSYKWK